MIEHGRGLSEVGATIVIDFEVVRSDAERREVVESNCAVGGNLALGHPFETKSKYIYIHRLDSSCITYITLTATLTPKLLAENIVKQ